MGQREYKMVASPASPGRGWVGLAEGEANVLSQLGQEEITEVLLDCVCLVVKLSSPDQHVIPLHDILFHSGW